MIGITSFLLASYLMIAMSYTFEAFINKKACEKYWYFFPVVLLWCIVVGLIYFPCDLGAKLYKKLNDTKN